MHFSHWHTYFLSNKSHFDALDFKAEDQLTHHEKKAIASSLQQFQKGESSEGKHLYSFAKQIADPSYMQCIKLFIPEEQTHARVLAKFMKIHSIAPIKDHWVDSVFRWLRKIGGIANTIRILLIAEIIASIYYIALRNATNSSLLQQICDQILEDEDAHIRFQCDALKLFNSSKTDFYRFMLSCWMLFLMLGTIVVVWVHHRKVFTRGGYGFWKYAKDTLAQFAKAEAMMNLNLQMAKG